VLAILTDLRYGIRQLRKAPGFTSVAVTVLAVGVGANITIFGFARDRNQSLDTLPMFHWGGLRPVPVAAGQKCRHFVAVATFLSTRRASLAFAQSGRSIPSTRLSPDVSACTRDVFDCHEGLVTPSHITPDRY
jgi:hypothetical protein